MEIIFVKLLVLLAFLSWSQLFCDESCKVTPPPPLLTCAMSTILSRGSGGGEEGKNGFLPVGACAVALPAIPLEQFWVQEGRGGDRIFICDFTSRVFARSIFLVSPHHKLTPKEEKKVCKNQKKHSLKKEKERPEMKHLSETCE